MLKDIALAIWFFLPAGAANASPIPASKLRWLRQWNTPIDCGLTFRGKRLLGPHKTWRGLAVGFIAALLVVVLQQVIVRHFSLGTWLADGVHYTSLRLILLALLFDIGALGGDAIKSFFKRQRNKPAGETWFPFDQTDYIIGSIATTLPFVRLHWPVYVWALILWPTISLGASYIGYKFRLKDKPI